MTPSLSIRNYREELFLEILQEKKQNLIVKVIEISVLLLMMKI